MRPFQKKLQQRIIAFGTALVFTVTSLPFLAHEAWAETDGIRPAQADARPFWVPAELGTVEEISSSGREARRPSISPFVVHLQTAHGDYEAQKKIAALLEFLTRRYGIDLLLLEGAGVKLHPELDRYFQNPEWNRQILEGRTQRGLATGAGLFLLDNLQDPRAKRVQAVGIESIRSYRKNRLAFQRVLRDREKHKRLIEEFNERMQKNFEAGFSRPLREFLRRQEAFERRTLGLDAWFRELHKNSRQILGLNLQSASSQKEWPALVRLARLLKIERRLDRRAIRKDSGRFLNDVRRFLPKSIFQELEILLLGGRGEGEGDIRFLLERAVDRLPLNFVFDRYPYLKIWLQWLVFRNEIKPDVLSEELDRLGRLLSFRLAKTAKEKRHLKEFFDYRFLRRLFELEITAKDYPRLKRLDRVRLPGALSSFLRKAIGFYEGAKERERWMAENVEREIRRHGARAVILITGGFHTDGLRETFHQKGFSYALVSPRFDETVSGGEGEVESRESYFNAFLGKPVSPYPFSQIEDAAALPVAYRDYRWHGVDFRPIQQSRKEARREFLKSGFSVIRSEARNDLTPFREVGGGILKNENPERLERFPGLDSEAIGLAQKRIRDSGFEEIQYPEWVRAGRISAAAGKPVYLYDATRNPGNSFKILGVLNFVLQEIERAKTGGRQIEAIATQTTFNHGYALLLAFEKLAEAGKIDRKKTRLVVAVGEDSTGPEKIKIFRQAQQRLKKQGITFELLIRKTYDKAKEAVSRLKKDQPGKVIRVNHFAGVVTGYATIFDEIFNQIRRAAENGSLPAKRIGVAVPVGAGGLVAGAKILKDQIRESGLDVEVKVIGVQTPGIDGFYEAMRNGREVTRAIPPGTLSKGIAVERIEIPWKLAWDVVDYVVKVDEVKYGIPAVREVAKDLKGLNQGEERRYEVTAGVTAAAPTVFRDFWEKEGMDAFVVLLSGANENHEVWSGKIFPSPAQTAPAERSEVRSEKVERPTPESFTDLLRSAFKVADPEAKSPQQLVAPALIRFPDAPDGRRTLIDKLYLWDHDAQIRIHLRALMKAMVQHGKFLETGSPVTDLMNVSGFTMKQSEAARLAEIGRVMDLWELAVEKKSVVFKNVRLGKIYGASSSKGSSQTLKRVSIPAQSFSLGNGWWNPWGTLEKALSLKGVSKEGIRQSLGPLKGIKFEGDGRFFNRRKVTSRITTIGRGSPELIVVMVSSPKFPATRYLTLFLFETGGKTLKMVPLGRSSFSFRVGGDPEGPFFDLVANSSGAPSHLREAVAVVVDAKGHFHLFQAEDGKPIPLLIPKSTGNGSMVWLKQDELETHGDFDFFVDPDDGGVRIIFRQEGTEDITHLFDLTGRLLARSAPPKSSTPSTPEFVRSEVRVTFHDELTPVALAHQEGSAFRTTKQLATAYQAFVSAPSEEAQSPWREQYQSLSERWQAQAGNVVKTWRQISPALERLAELESQFLSAIFALQLFEKDGALEKVREQRRHVKETGRKTRTFRLPVGAGERRTSITKEGAERIDRLLGRLLDLSRESERPGPPSAQAKKIGVTHGILDWRRRNLIPEDTVILRMRSPKEDEAFPVIEDFPVLHLDFPESKLKFPLVAEVDPSGLDRPRSMPSQMTLQGILEQQFEQYLDAARLPEEKKIALRSVRKILQESGYLLAAQPLHGDRRSVTFYFVTPEGRHLFKPETPADSLELWINGEPFLRKSISSPRRSELRGNELAEEIYQEMIEVLAPDDLMSAARESVNGTNPPDFTIISNFVIKALKGRGLSEPDGRDQAGLRERARVVNKVLDLFQGNRGFIRHLRNLSAKRGLLQKIQASKGISELKDYASVLGRLEGIDFMPALEDIERFSPNKSPPNKKGTVPKKGDSPLLLVKKYLRLYHATWRRNGSPEGKVPEAAPEGDLTKRNAFLNQFPLERLKRGTEFVRQLIRAKTSFFGRIFYLIRRLFKPKIVSLTHLPAVREFIERTGVRFELFAAREYLSPVGSFKWRQYVNLLIENREAIDSGKLKEAVIYSSGNAIQGLLYTVRYLKKHGIVLKDGTLWKLPPDFKVTMVAYTFLNETKKKKIRKFEKPYYLWRNFKRVPTVDLVEIVYLDDFILNAQVAGVLDPGESEDKIKHRLVNINELLVVLEAYAKEKGMLHVYASNGESMALGGASILEDIREAIGDPDYLVMPSGGGGPLVGMTLDSHAHGGKTKVIGAVPMLRDASMADGLAIQMAQKLAVETLQAFGSKLFEFVEFPEDLLIRAFVDLNQAGYKVEPSAAASLAVVYFLMSKEEYRPLLRDRRIAIVLTGANFTPDTLSRARDLYASLSRSEVRRVKTQRGFSTALNRPPSSLISFLSSVLEPTISALSSTLISAISFLNSTFVWAMSALSSRRVSLRSFNSFEVASSSLETLPLMIELLSSTIWRRSWIPWFETSISSNLLSSPEWPSAILLTSVLISSSSVPTSVTVYASIFLAGFTGFSLFIAILLVNEFFKTGGGSVAPAGEFVNIENGISSDDKNTYFDKRQPARSEVRSPAQASTPPSPAPSEPGAEVRVSTQPFFSWLGDVQEFIDYRDHPANLGEIEREIQTVKDLIGEEGEFNPNGLPAQEHFLELNREQKRLLRLRQVKKQPQKIQQTLDQLLMQWVDRYGTEESLKFLVNLYGHAETGRSMNLYAYAISLILLTKKEAYPLFFNEIKKRARPYSSGVISRDSPQEPRIHFFHPFKGFKNLEDAISRNYELALIYSPHPRQVGRFKPYFAWRPVFLLHQGDFFLGKPRDGQKDGSMREEAQELASRLGFVESAKVLQPDEQGIVIAVESLPFLALGQSLVPQTGSEIYAHSHPFGNVWVQSPGDTPVRDLSKLDLVRTSLGFDLDRLRRQEAERLRKPLDSKQGLTVWQVREQHYQRLKKMEKSTQAAASQPTSLSGLPQLHRRDEARSEVRSGEGKSGTRSRDFIYNVLVKNAFIVEEAESFVPESAVQAAAQFGEAKVTFQHFPWEVHEALSTSKSGEHDFGSTYVRSADPLNFVLEAVKGAESLFRFVHRPGQSVILEGTLLSKIERVGEAPLFPAVTGFGYSKTENAIEVFVSEPLIRHLGGEPGRTVTIEIPDGFRIKLTGARVEVRQETNRAELTLAPNQIRLLRGGRKIQNVVIVEDDEGMRETLKAHFKGKKITEFGDGEAALRSLLDKRVDKEIDLLVIDNGLPGLNGRDLIEALRAEGVQAPILLHTGSPDQIGEGWVREVEQHPGDSNSLRYFELTLSGVKALGLNTLVAQKTKFTDFKALVERLEEGRAFAAADTLRSEVRSGEEFNEMFVWNPAEANGDFGTVQIHFPSGSRAAVRVGDNLDQNFFMIQGGVTVYEKGADAPPLEASKEQSLPLDAGKEWVVSDPENPRRRVLISLSEGPAPNVRPGLLLRRTDPQIELLPQLPAAALRQIFRVAQGQELEISGLIVNGTRRKIWIQPRERRRSRGGRALTQVRIHAPRVVKIAHEDHFKKADVPSLLQAIDPTQDWSTHLNLTVGSNESIRFLLGGEPGDLDFSFRIDRVEPDGSVYLEPQGMPRGSAISVIDASADSWSEQNFPGDRTDPSFFRSEARRALAGPRTRIGTISKSAGRDGRRISRGEVEMGRLRRGRPPSRAEVRSETPEKQFGNTKVRLILEPKVNASSPKIFFTEFEIEKPVLPAVQKILAGLNRGGLTPDDGASYDNLGPVQFVELIGKHGWPQRAEVRKKPIRGPASLGLVGRRALEARNQQGLSNHPLVLKEEAPSLWEEIKRKRVPIDSLADGVVYVWSTDQLKKIMAREYKAGHFDETMRSIMQIDEFGPVGILAPQARKRRFLFGWNHRKDRQKLWVRAVRDNQFAYEDTTDVRGMPIYGMTRYVKELMASRRAVIPDIIVRHGLVEWLGKHGRKVFWGFGSEKTGFIETFRGRDKPYRHENLDYGSISMPRIRQTVKVKTKDGTFAEAEVYNQLPNKDLWHYPGGSMYFVARADANLIKRAGPDGDVISNLDMADLNSHVASQHLDESATLWVQDDEFEDQVFMGREFTKRIRELGRTGRLKGVRRGDAGFDIQFDILQEANASNSVEVFVGAGEMIAALGVQNRFPDFDPAREKVFFAVDFAAREITVTRLVSKKGTGRDSGIETLRALDRGVKIVTGAAQETGAALVAISDHGGLDGADTPGHSASDVPFMILDYVKGGGGFRKISLKDRPGTQADAAPALLHLLGIKIPEAMTGESFLPDGVQGRRDRPGVFLITDGFAPKGEKGNDPAFNLTQQALDAGLLPTLQRLLQEAPNVTVPAAGRPAGLRGRLDLNPQYPLSRSRRIVTRQIERDRSLREIVFIDQDTGKRRVDRRPEGLLRLRRSPYLNDRHVNLEVRRGKAVVRHFSPVQKGSTEFNLWTFGAGRIVDQYIVLADEAFEGGELSRSPAIQSALKAAKRLGFMPMTGIFQEGIVGVHASMQQLYRLIEYFKKNGVDKFVFFGASDGRDEGTTDGVKRIAELEAALDYFGVPKKNYAIHVGGREIYFDRARRWGLIRAFLSTWMYGSRRILDRKFFRPSSSRAEVRAQAYTVYAPEALGILVNREGPTSVFKSEWSSKKGERFQFVAKELPDFKFEFKELPTKQFQIRRLQTNESQAILWVEIFHLSGSGVEKKEAVAYFFANLNKKDRKITDLQVSVDALWGGQGVMGHAYEEVGKHYPVIEEMTGEIGEPSTILLLAQKIPNQVQGEGSEAWPRYYGEIQNLIRTKNTSRLTDHLLAFHYVYPEAAAQIFSPNVIGETILGKLRRRAGFTELSLVPVISPKRLPGRSGNMILLMVGRRPTQVGRLPLDEAVQRAEVRGTDDEKKRTQKELFRQIIDAQQDQPTRQGDRLRFRRQRISNNLEYVKTRAGMKTEAKKRERERRMKKDAWERLLRHFNKQGKVQFDNPVDIFNFVNRVRKQKGLTPLTGEQFRELPIWRSPKGTGTTVKKFVNEGLSFLEKQQESAKKEKEERRGSEETEKRAEVRFDTVRRVAERLLGRIYRPEDLVKFPELFVVPEAVAAEGPEAGAFRTIAREVTTGFLAMTIRQTGAKTAFVVGPEMFAKAGAFLVALGQQRGQSPLPEIFVVAPEDRAEADVARKVAIELSQALEGSQILVLEGPSVAVRLRNFSRIEALGLEGDQALLKRIIQDLDWQRVQRETQAYLSYYSEVLAGALERYAELYRALETAA